MNTPDVVELQRENEQLKDAFRKIIEHMNVFLPKHFDSKNPKHAAMYEVYHIAIHSIRK